MQKRIIEGLFGGEERLKLIKLFVFNPSAAFDAATLARRTESAAKIAEKEASILEKMGFLRKRAVSVEVEKRRGKKLFMERKKVKGWVLSPSFAERPALEEFFVKANTLSHDEIVRKVGKAGKPKLILTAGLFIQYPESRLDMLAVCDRVNKRVLDRAIKSFEAEIGREIRYTALETADFQYRYSMRDKLVRDVLDYPHQVVLDRLGVTSA